MTSHQPSGVGEPMQKQSMAHDGVKVSCYPPGPARAEGDPIEGVLDCVEEGREDEEQRGRQGPGEYGSGGSEGGPVTALRRSAQGMDQGARGVSPAERADFLKRMAAGDEPAAATAGDM